MTQEAKFELVNEEPGKKVELGVRCALKITFSGKAEDLADIRHAVSRTLGRDIGVLKPDQNGNISFTEKRPLGPFNEAMRSMIPRMYERGAMSESKIEVELKERDGTKITPPSRSDLMDQLGLPNPSKD